MKRPDPLEAKQFPEFKQEALVAQGRSRITGLVPLFFAWVLLGVFVVLLLACVYWLATLTPWFT